MLDFLTPERYLYGDMGTISKLYKTVLLDAGRLSFKKMEIPPWGASLSSTHVHGLVNRPKARLLTALVDQENKFIWRFTKMN